MQSVMFNSQHISVSKDTLHSHKILTSSLETKISSMHSRKDQKNEITHQHTSRAAVNLLDPLISCCSTTAEHISSTEHDRDGCEKNQCSQHNGHTGTCAHKHACIVEGLTMIKLQNIRRQTTLIFSYYSCSSGSNQMHIKNNDSSMAFACPCGKYHIINHITKK